ncbi:MAG: oligosaccharide flippase family protein, partial [Thermomicrobiales bacterium]
HKLDRRLLSGGIFLFASSALVNVGNYGFNLLFGRWLGPERFSDLTLIITLVLLTSFTTSTLGMIAARFAARAAAAGDLAEVASYRHWLGRMGWGAGIAVSLVLMIGARQLQSFFHTASFWPFVILGSAIPLFFVQGVDRGILQGQTHFRRLSLSYQAEMWTRLLCGVLLVGLGFGVSGAVGAIAASFVATWIVAKTGVGGLPPKGVLSASARREVLLFALPVLTTLFGEILINHSDILIAKRFFSAEDAGHYSALSLIGRVVFFASWPIAAIVFPLVTQRAHQNKSHRWLLFLSLGVVVTIGGSITLVTAIAPELVIRTLFGPAYISVAPLLWIYAAATTLYTIANAIVSYQLALGKGFGSILALLAGVFQVLLLWTFHNSLRQMVIVQFEIMVVLLAASVVWMTLSAMRNPDTARGTNSTTTHPDLI